MAADERVGGTSDLPLVHQKMVNGQKINHLFEFEAGFPSKNTFPRKKL